MPEPRLRAGNGPRTPAVTESRLFLLTMHSRPVILTCVAVGASALLVAGCGGGNGSPGVANIASPSATGTTATTTTQGAGSGQTGKSLGKPPGQGGQFQISMS